MIKVLTVVNGESLDSNPSQLLEAPDLSRIEPDFYRAAFLNFSYSSLVDFLEKQLLYQLV